MITFQYIKWKNFLSTGNVFTEVNFCDNKSTIIIGPNGSGKSTILDALTYSLFGKSFRGINKPQLINSINDGYLVVEVEFQIRNNNWKIIRGMKPSIFEIYKNNELLDQHASSVDQQHWFEENILKMNYKSFTQIVILGSSNFVPFMQMTSSHRREVIEDLLDIKIFSSMNNVLKEKIKNERLELNKFRTDLKFIDEKIQLQKNFIEEIDRRDNEFLENSNNKILELIDINDKLENKNKQLEENLQSINDDINSLSLQKNKLLKLNTLKGKLREKKSILKSTIKFFEKNTVCPTCTQGIEDDFRLNKIGDTQNKLIDIENGYGELESTIKDEEKRHEKLTNLTRSLSNLTNEIYQNNIRISSNQKQIRYIESEIQNTTQKSSDRNTEYEKLKEYKNTKENIQDNILNIQETISYYNYTTELLKDSGIKSQIIKNYLPLINQQISRFLKLMDFSINFTLNEEFEESIISPIHENYTYTSFSEGERQRIDLALLFTWRELAKAKNSINTNLLILDEIFDSSLDNSGTDDFIKIIKFIIKDCNIFVISHKDNLIDKFDNVINVEKKGNFSTMFSIT